MKECDLFYDCFIAKIENHLPFVMSSGKDMRIALFFCFSGGEIVQEAKILKGIAWSFHGVKIIFYVPSLSLYMHAGSVIVNLTMFPWSSASSFLSIPVQSTGGTAQPKW